ncbi:hypothetical protein [Alteromonas sp. OM2203]|uniref:hypothetical protein n=1 Tax=Alteromonas sp. OM2203 TaxID=3398817 RepID=UPI003AF34B05
MKKSNHQGKVLKDHKKVGKKFIPPLMQMDMMRETSFVNDRLPCLIWMSALYRRIGDRKATEFIVDFIETAYKCSEGEKVAPLQYMGSYTSLPDSIKNELYGTLKTKPYFNDLLSNLEHQYHLLKSYPFAFLFSEHQYGVDREDAIEMLKEDVESLLDRMSSEATKVQVTAVYAEMTSGRMKISAHIDLPDFNAIFKAPESEDAKRVAGFARAHINGFAAASFLKEIGIPENQWPKTFWDEAFDLDGCENGY